MNTTRRLFDPRTPANKIDIIFDCRHTSLVAQAEKLQLNYLDGTEYRLLQRQFKSYRASGIEELLAKQQRFAEDKEIVDGFAEDLENKQQGFDELLESLADCEFNLDLISDAHKEEIEVLTERANADLALVRREVRFAKEMVHHIANQFKACIKESNWRKSSKANEKQVAAKKKELSEKGVKDISNFEQLSK